MKILFRDGKATMIYNEEFDLSSLGESSIRRASHVEPTPDGKWTADMTPVNGPVLGPFEKRSEALKAEIEYIEQKVL